MHHEIIFRERSDKGLSMEANRSACRGRELSSIRREFFSEVPHRIKRER